MDPQIKHIGEKNLAGKKLAMSLLENKTSELWKSFMQLRPEVKNNIGNDLYSMQVYGANYFNNFDPAAKFEKWATIEVNNFENLPVNFDCFVLPAGLYAVFQHKGVGTDIFKTIYTEWLPNSGFLLDNRPHFEILGEKYKNGDLNSEEEIWIPIKQKNKFNMEQRITFITLGVKDLKTSIDFYENKFGWKRSELSNDNIIFYELNGLHISLYNAAELAKDATVDPNGTGFKGFTIAYNTRSVEEVDSLIRSLKEKGVGY
jgi:AraC family transcriptional regulator